MKSIIIRIVESPRLAKQLFLVLLDLAIFPILIWLCYALREFNLGAAVVPNISLGALCVSLIAVGALIICGIYRFIVRSFNEAFIARLAMATTVTVIGLFVLAYLTQIGRASCRERV